MSRIFRFLIAYTILTTAFLWLFVLRAVTLPDADWALFGLGGVGVAGDFWIVALLLLFNGIMLALGWRGAHPPFHLMLLLWLVTLTVVAISRFLGQVVNPIATGAAWEPDNWTGLSMALLVGSSILALTLGLIWVSIDLRRGRPRPIRTSLPPGQPFGSTVAGASLVALLALPILVLLRMGSNPSWAPPTTVILAILQWWLLNTTVLQPSSRGYGELPASEAMTPETLEG